MYSHPFGRRYLMVLQAALGLLLVMAVFDLSMQRGALTSSAEQAASSVKFSGLSLQLAQGNLAFSTENSKLGALAAFDALNRRAGSALEVTWDSQTGIPRFLTGRGASTRLPYIPTAAEIGNPLAIARGFLDQNRALFRLDAVTRDFGPARFEPDKQLNFSQIRLPQLYNGIPVFGRQLAVHLDQKDQVVAVNGQYVPGLNISTRPSLTKEQAEQFAVTDVKERELDPGDGVHMTAKVFKDRTTLTVYVDDKGKATLAWSVEMLTNSPLGEWTIFVNANRLAVVHAIDRLANAKNRQTYSAGNTTNIPGKLLAQEGERSSDPIGQAAHDNAAKVYDYYLSTFKRDSIDGQGGPIISSVHYGSDPADAENAAWIGDANQMVYGDGGRIFKPLAYGLDIVGHELTHGVTGSTSNLIYEGQSGALNESYSDIFGAMIDRANWTMGETVVKSPPFPVPYLRNLQDPEMGGLYDPSNPLSGEGQPGDMSRYANLPLTRKADYGGVHINSGIPSRAAYLVATAIGKEKMEQIYYRTLTQYLTPDANFADAGRATVRAATDLYGATEVNAVQAAFRQVGIDLGSSQVTPVPTTPAGPSRTPSPGLPLPRPSTSTPGPTFPTVNTPTPNSSFPTPSLPTPGPTTTTPAPNVPQGCRELIVNGGFEGTSGWKEVNSSHTSIIDPQLPHTGAQSAWLGGTDQESVQYIRQDVTLPANATSVKLSYYRLLHSETSGLGGLIARDATFTVLLADTNGNQIAKIETLLSSQGDDTWRQAQFDLSRYAGRTVRIVFSAANPRGNVSSLFIDDVSMTACTTGQGPAVPSPAAADQVYIQGHVVDADTGRGISGAQLFILKPGLTATDAAADGEITDDEVLTYGTSDSQGAYQTLDPVPRGHTYSVVLIAGGYRAVLADNGLALPADAPNPTQVDATMRAGF
jgi:Zn-dependent metalloprotease